MKYVSEGQHDAWRRQAAPGPRGAPDEVREYLDLRNRILKELADAGTPIMIGTDSPQLFNVPGLALHREIAVMSEAGMTNQQILESGTATVDRYGIDHRKITHSFGTVSVGQRADLVLLGSNPLDDLDNLHDRAGVMIVDEKPLLWLLLQPSSSGSAGGTTLRLPLAESI